MDPSSTFREQELTELGTNNSTTIMDPMYTLIIYHVGFDGMVLSGKLKRGLVAKHKPIHNGWFIPDSVLVATKDFLACFGEDLTIEETIHHKKGLEPTRKVFVKYRKVKELTSPQKHAEKMLEDLLNRFPEAETRHADFIKSMFPFVEAAKGSTVALAVPIHPE